MAKLIQYIGKGEGMRDMIRFVQHRVWIGRGSVVSVGDDEAQSYLNHPTVFREVTEEQLQAEKQQEAAREIRLDTLTEAVKAMPRETLETMLATIKGELDTRDAEQRAHIESVPVLDPTAVNGIPIVATETDLDQINARANAIRIAVQSLETGNPDHFTSAGKPRVGAVKDATGLDVTAAEIDAAMQGA